MPPTGAMVVTVGTRGSMTLSMGVPPAGTVVGTVVGVVPLLGTTPRVGVATDVLPPAVGTAPAVVDPIAARTVDDVVALGNTTSAPGPGAVTAEADTGNVAETFSMANFFGARL